MSRDTEGVVVGCGSRRVRVRWRLLAIGMLGGCGRLNFDETQPLLGDVRHSLLSLDRIAPGSILTDFPLPVVLDGSRADLDSLSPETLRFRSSDGTELPYEIEAAGPPLVAWVLVPSIQGTSTTIEVEYGGAPSTPGRVFGNTYAGVWHMQGTGTAFDSSPFARDGEPRGTQSVTGMIGDARLYASTAGDCIVVRTFASVALPTFTLSAWFRLDGLAQAPFTAALTRQVGNAGNDDFFFGQGNQIPYLAFGTDMGTPAVTGGSLPFGTWHRVAGVYDGAATALYLDGVRVAMMPATGTPGTSANPLFIGCGHSSATAKDVGEGDYFEGALDEVRAESVARSEDWLRYEQAAHEDRAITYGPVESN